MKLHQWKVVTEELKAKPVNRTTLVEVTEQREDFISNFKLDLVKFRSHHERVLNQYHHIGLLKSNLAHDQVTMQMDFAENYVCSLRDEVAAAYFSKVQVTVHPAVIYYRVADSSLQHRSVVVLSNETSHKATTVCLFEGTNIVAEAGAPTCEEDSLSV